MITVEKFKQMGMLEQLEALENMKKTKNDHCIVALYDLYTHPLGDDAIDYMVGMTLRELLVENEQETVMGITHENPAIQKICLQICGQRCFASATPVLINLFKKHQDHKMMYETFLAMSKSDSKDFIEIFRNFMGHPKEDVAAIAIGMLGKHQDEASIDPLCRIVENGETDENYKKCDLITGAAIEALGQMPAVRAASFLVSKLHYRNPTGRLLVHQELVKKGKEVIPLFEKIMEEDDIDKKIMAANVLGLIGDKKGGEILILAMDKGVIKDLNVKYAVYEAIGRMQFMKGTIFLMDGFSEQDPLLLTAVMTSLDSQLHPGVTKKLTEMIQKGDQQSQRLVRAIVTAKAMKIFEILYQEHDLAQLFMESIFAVKDQNRIDAFREKLETIDSAEAKKDAKALSEVVVTKGGKRVLVADDSKAMLAFYQTAISGFGLTAVTAENGKDALDILHQGDTFDLILTDMNMPVMDGIEFTRLTRKNPEFRDTPIVMISTESEISQIELAKEAGVDVFLSKPFTQDKLLETIKKQLGSNLDL
ncbi:MAG: response regulator [Desulfobacterium sp.]|nr:response regulator [Desulfobacterium sp.]